MADGTSEAVEPSSVGPGLYLPILDKPFAIGS